MLDETIGQTSRLSLVEGRSALEMPERFREMLPMAVYACDSSGRILWFNRRAERLWGRAPRIGDDYDRFCGAYRLHFGGRPIAHRDTPMARVLETGQSAHDLEVAIERPDGSRVWCTVHIDPVLGDDGAVLGAINCFHDTTELHCATEALQRERQDLEDFFENAAVALHIVDAEGVIVRANGAELNLLGYRREEYVGRRIRDFHADPVVIDDILGRLTRGERLQGHPARLRAKDGSIRHVLITSNAQIREGRFVRTRCFTVDVTAARDAQERMEESEARFRQLLEALPAAVYTTDANGRLTYFNRAAAEFAGREPQLGSDEWCVTGRLYYPDGKHLPHDECPMAQALKEGRAIRNAEAIAERPDGTRVPFIPYPTPLLDRSGRVVGAVNMLVDISERKEAESQQRILLDELNHRIKNNMQMLHALLLAAQRDAGRRGKDPVAVLADATRRVAAMAAAQQALYDTRTPAQFDANQFLDAVCRTAAHGFPGDVRVVRESATGYLSNETAMPLALILNELLINAAKHGAPRGAGEIRVGLTREGEWFELYVEDDGPGFDLSAALSGASGLKLVMGLARQLRGNLRVGDPPGARCAVSFPQ